MNAGDFIPHLGKPADDPDLQQFLAGLGVTQAPKMKRWHVGMYAVAVDYPKAQDRIVVLRLMARTPKA